MFYGDDDPDDAWDASDTVAEQLRVLVRRVLWLAEHVTAGDTADRAERIVADLAFLRARVLARDLGD